MTSIEINLPNDEKPRTASVALPSLGHWELDEFSNLAHGYFAFKNPSAQKVAPTAVNDFLRDVLGKKAPTLSENVSPDLFALVLSRGLYAARLKMAANAAERHNLFFLSTPYNQLYRMNAAETLHAIDQVAGTKLSQRSVQLKGFADGKSMSDPRILTHAYGFFGRHWNTLRQIAGLPAVETENPQVLEKLPKSKQPKNHDQVHLTFDDGPGPWTNQVLRELSRLEEEKNQKLPVTFFVTGDSMDALKEGKDVVKRASALGHEIASHSSSHDFNLGGSPSKEVLKREVDEHQTRLRNLVEKPVTHFRFPGGIFSLKSWMHVLGRGMRHVDWSVDTRDYHLAEQTAFEHQKDNNQALINAAHKELIDRVSLAKAGDVILMHDSEVLQPNEILSFPLTWTSPQAKQADAKGRLLRANARGIFLVQNLSDVVDALHAKNLKLAPLPQDLRLYSRSYLTRLGLKLVQSFPGVRRMQGVARKAVSKARKFAGDAFMRGRKRRL